MSPETLDPADWDATRRVFHEAVDLALDHLRGQGGRPPWLPTPAAVKDRLKSPAPREPTALAALLTDFARDILPYGTGNTHARFFGWVHGSGTVAGALGEMLAGFMNCNVGGRDHVAVYVERQVLDWCKDLFHFPVSASGLLTSGSSMATIIALAAARDQRRAAQPRRLGLLAAQRPLVGYASTEAHSAVAKAFDLLGLGREALRLVPVDDDFRLVPPALASMIAADRASGLDPFVVIASAGTVNTGAIDPLNDIAELCAEHRLWLHVDAAFGGLAALVPALRERVAGISRSDSVAFDFHKWLHVPYDAGCVLIRDEAAHRAAFADRRDYLVGAARGLAGGDPWFCDYGPELSRGFRALKIWFTIKAHGLDALGEAIARNCRQAQRLGRAIAESRDLELLAPVGLNIVCFRYIGAGADDAALDALNAEIVTELHLRGIAVPSTTKLAGRTAIRVALTNHRTTDDDLEALLSGVRVIGDELMPSGRVAGGRR